MKAERRRRGAFTLLEVLGAVLILGMLYTVLAETAIRGLRSEGISRRRAEASLLADRKLVELEALIAAGAPPEIGSETEEGDLFRITLEILEQDALGLLPDVERGLAEEEAATESLLVDAKGDSRFRRIRVTVAWDEAGDPYEVVRNTFDFDRTVLASLFPAGEDGAVDGEEGGSQLGEGNRGRDSGRSAGRASSRSGGTTSRRGSDERGGTGSARGIDESGDKQSIVEQMLQRLRDAKRGS